VLLLPQGLMAHVMAGSLMLFVLHVVVTILKSVNAFCAHAWCAVDTGSVCSGCTHTEALDNDCMFLKHAWK
jgi:hypothetical protein